MQRKKMLSLVGSIFLVGCSQLPSPPKDILAPEKMPPIIAEMQTAETRVSRLSLQSYDSSKVAFRELESRIFKKYGIDSAVYRRSYDFYARHPAYLEKIYQEAIEIIKKQGEAATKEAATQRKRPTLQ